MDRKTFNMAQSGKLSALSSRFAWLMVFGIQLMAFTFTSCTEEMEPTVPVTEQSFRSVPVNVSLPTARPGFVEGVSRAEGDFTTGTWEMLMELHYTVDGVEHFIYATVTLSDGEVTDVRQDFVGVTGAIYPEPPLLLQYDSQKGFTIRVSSVATSVSEPTGVCYYAPAMKWNQYFLKIEKIKKDADTYNNTFEQWSWNGTAWTTGQARVRVSGLNIGDKVRFGDDFTAIADAAGNACFYFLESEMLERYTVEVNELSVFTGSTALTVGKAYHLTMTPEMQIEILMKDHHSKCPGTYSWTIDHEQDLDNLPSPTALKYNLPSLETLDRKLRVDREDDIHLFSSTVTEIKNGELDYWLKCLYLPAVTTVEFYAFQDCTYLETVHLSAVTSLPNDLFRLCTSLKNVTLSSIKELGNFTISGLTNLESVYLPAVTSVAQGAFDGCSSLTRLIFGTPVTSMESSFSDVTTTNCDLILAAGQIDVERLAPDTRNNIWAGKLWKSITLVQASGEY